jgi:ATP-dependent Clp protease ATP-binding subunit ClpC
MFERYTEGARRVVFWARYFAHQIGSPTIEAEHLLLGLLREDMILARRFLGSPWALEEVWGRVGQNKVERPAGPVDLPLSNTSRHVLSFAAAEADKLSSKRIGTAHLLLSLLREEKCTAAEILNDRGVRLVPIREELTRSPHDDSVREEFVRERGPLPEDIVEVQIRIRSIKDNVSAAIANHDFANARAYGDDERKERDRLYFLCQKYKLPDWLYE